MKTLSKKQIITILTILVMLVAVGSVLLVLFLSRYDDPIALTDAARSPYGNYDYSKRRILPILLTDARCITEMPTLRLRIYNSCVCR